MALKLQDETLEPLKMRDRILELARGYLQDSGFNSLSFQKIADELKIKKPSLFHHFVSKEALGLRVIEQYQQAFDKWALKVDSLEPQLKIKKYLEIFENFLKDDAKLCPIAALGTEINDLPNSMKKQLRALGDQHYIWLEQTIKDGVKAKKFKISSDPGATSTMILSAIQGSLMISRVRQDDKCFYRVRSSIQTMLGL